MAQGIKLGFLALAVFAVSCSDNRPEPLCKTDRERKTEEWCEAMMLKANNEWLEDEFKAFSCDCL
ncbi:hypothetical protein P886_3533 [Alteromonadaceae bacterium 2753L.S.0a.02]|nr:hypothetical protein P886_3533 [Alteromonadaceae bacterium 2753L.S.0a.02]